MQPLALLRAGADSYAPLLGADGELRDPVFNVPTQYSTPYHALCRAVLAARGRGGPGGEAAAQDAAGRDLEAAARACDAALRHVEDRAAPPHASSFHRTLGTSGAGNHRDFFWPALLRTLRLLRAMGAAEADALAARVAAVNIEAAFTSRPPSNWSAVWLSGEWLRMRDGLSGTPLRRFDAWLGAFFESGRLLLDRGFYQEPGHPNSYDLFTRVHLAEILAEGYAGRWRPELERLMETGLDRSLAVQLSDGALASAHRSTGQSWNDGAQCAFFTLAAAHFRARDPRRAAAAEAAAWRALGSLARWQRTDGPFSPVYNRLPPDWRVGYEGYTADGHYGNLALGLLAAAVLRGFGDAAPPEVVPPPPAAFVEGDPVWRALVHHGPYSAQVNAFPAAHYDAFGLTDATFGPGRRFHFGPSARCPGEAGFFNLGMAVRSAPGRSALRILAQEPMHVVGGIEAGSGAELRLRARPQGDAQAYALCVRADGAGIHVEERLAGHSGWVSLLVPYLADEGGGTLTEVEIAQSETTVVRFRHGSERVRLICAGACAHVLNLTRGYESRRGLCGLVRLDLADRGDGVRYSLAAEA